MSSGWSAISKHMVEAKERQDAFARGDYNKARVFPLIVKSGQEGAAVSFIPNKQGEVEPWAGMVHTLPKTGGRGFVTRKCQGERCPDCQVGDKAKFRAFFTVIDHRERTFTFTKGDKAGQEGTSKDQVAYYECSAANADMLFNKFQRAQKKLKIANLQDAVVDISKYGSGTSTTTSYEFEPRADTNYQVPQDAEPIDFVEFFSVGNSGTSSGQSTGNNSTDKANYD